MARHQQHQVACLANGKLQKISRWHGLARGRNHLHPANAVRIARGHGVLAVFAPFRVDVVRILKTLDQTGHLCQVVVKQLEHVLAALLGPGQEPVLILDDGLYPCQVVRRSARDLDPPTFDGKP